MSNLDNYKIELDKINSSKNKYRDINMLLWIYTKLENEEKEFYYHSFKYVIYDYINYLLGNAEKTNNKWDIQSVKTKISNILNADPDFDFSILKKEKLDELVLEVKTIRI